MSNLNLEVSRDDLLQLSAMLDGEIEDSALDVLLVRMANEPALGRAWTRLSQVQAATHRHAQVGFDLDLSGAIAEKLATSQSEQVPTPVVAFRKPHESYSTKAVHLAPEVHSKGTSKDAHAEIFAKNESQDGAHEASQRNISHVLDIAPYNGVDRRHIEESKVQVAKKKGFKQQLLAHLAVAASVASVTVWIQNSFITGSEIADVTPSMSVQAESIQAETPIAGVIPAALRDAQSLPMATVGNAASASGQGLGVSHARVEPAGGASVNDVPEEPFQAENP